MNWEEAAVDCISRILGDDVVPLEDILEAMPQAASGTQFRLPILKQLHNTRQLDYFLRRHQDRFFVENESAVVFDPTLVQGREAAVRYFESELDLYDEPPNCINFRGHVGQAEEDAIDFINSFYLGDEFRNFLLAHPYVFHVLENDTVILIENASVDFFSECIRKRRQGLHFMNLRGHLGQAPAYVVDYIKRYYRGEHFLEFLLNHNDVFTVNPENRVFLDST